jgi:hypothetical protein
MKASRPIPPLVFPSPMARSPEARFLSRQRDQARVGIRMALTDFGHQLRRAAVTPTLHRRRGAGGVAVGLLAGIGIISVARSPVSAYRKLSHTVGQALRFCVSAALTHWFWPTLLERAPACGRRARSVAT